MCCNCVYHLNKIRAECWCGNSYGKHGITNGCTMRCGENTECGSGFKNSIYRIGIKISFSFKKILILNNNKICREFENGNHQNFSC